MATKRYHIGDVLSITTGRLVSPRGMDGIYDILNYMTGETLFTHQLPRAMRQVLPWLTKQFPTLPGEKDAPEFRQAGDVEVWVAEIAAKHGEYLDVSPAPAGEDGPRDPIQEAVELFGRDRVIVVKADPNS